MTKIIITVILVNIVISIISGPYDQNFILKIMIYIFSVNKVAIKSAF